MSILSTRRQPKRARLGRGSTYRSGDSLGLSFSQRNGPLVAVVGLCGGAGTTLLSYLLASAAARESSDDLVLVADLGGPGASIAAYSEVSSEYSMIGAGLEIARNRTPRPNQLFARGYYGLRVIANQPDLLTIDRDTDDRTRAALNQGMEVLFDNAKRAHGLTVVDCGTMQRTPEIECVRAASHVIWITTSSEIGFRRCRAALRTIDPIVTGQQILLTRMQEGVAQVPFFEISDFAEERNTPLVLMPAIDDPLDRDVAKSIDDAGETLTSLGALLRR